MSFLTDEFPPSVVLLKENTYVRPDTLDYFSFTAYEEDGDIGTVQLLFPRGTGLNVTDVNKKDFERVADVANWYFQQAEREVTEPAPKVS